MAAAFPSEFTDPGSSPQAYSLQWWAPQVSYADEHLPSPRLCIAVGLRHLYA